MEENKELRKLLTTQQEQISGLIPKVGNNNTTINNDVWVDTANYPPSTKISAKKDLYMVVVQNPPTPQLEFKNFRYANSPNSALRTQREEVILIPDQGINKYKKNYY